jgi:hypothetical protein
MLDSIFTGFNPTITAIFAPPLFRHLFVIPLTGLGHVMNSGLENLDGREFAKRNLKGLLALFDHSAILDEMRSMCAPRSGQLLNRLELKSVKHVLR